MEPGRKVDFHWRLFASSPEEAEDILKVTLQTCSSFNEASIRLGVVPQTLRQYCKRHPDWPRPRYTTLWNKLEMTNEEVLALRKRFYSMSDLAKHLGMSTMTLLNEFHRRGLRVSPRKPAIKRIDRYLLEHPGVVLPATYKKIASLVGCEPDTVRKYFHFKRKGALEWLGSYDLTTLPLVLKTSNDRGYLPTKALRDYTVHFKYASMTITLQGTRYDGMEVECLLEFCDLRDLILEACSQSKP